MATRERALSIQVEEKTLTLPTALSERATSAHQQQSVRRGAKTRREREKQACLYLDVKLVQQRLQLRVHRSLVDHL